MVLKYIKPFYFVALIITVPFILSSCKDEYTLCDLSKDVRFIGAFYKKVGNSDISSPAPSLSIFALNVSTPLYKQQVNVDQFGLSLSSVLDTAKYVITLANNLQPDTLTIVYKSQGTNLSLECGSVIYNNITKLTSTTNTIDSVKILNPLINTQAIINAKIYY